MYRAINAVLRESKTEWLAYLNSDDCVYPDTFSRLLSRAELEGAGIVYGNCDYVDYQGRFLYSFCSARPALLVPLFRRGIFGFAQQAAIFRSSVYQALNGFDEKYSLSSDADFYSRALLLNIGFSRLPGAPVASFRLHANQLTNTMSEAMEKEKTAIRSLFCPARPLADGLAVLRWRVNNLPNYSIRFLRKFLLGCRRGR
jgi:GT2 family glycosyltransferase